MNSTPTPAARPLRTIAFAALAALSLLLLALPAQAQAGLSLVTAYPAVAVEPGKSVTFPLTVTAAGRQRVELEVTEVPDGWDATLRGGGFVVDGVYTDPDTPPSVNLEVSVPADVSEGTHQIVVTARAGGEAVTLPLSLRVAQEAGGSVKLTSEFPSLKGASDGQFSYTLTLTNDTPAETTFSLEATGPEGWIVTASPQSQTQASTATVGAGAETTVTVTADPPDDVAAGEYPLRVEASGGGQSAAIDLTAEVTGRFALTLTTPDERLNADLVAGRPTRVALVVINDGSSPLEQVTLSSTPPSDWEVTFEPESLAGVAPGDTAEVTAVITPSKDAVAGDYLVNLTASGGQATDSVELRTTVKASRLWGLVGLALIAAAVVGLSWVFRRYGRR